jgi:hypothetical protein
LTRVLNTTLTLPAARAGSCFAQAKGRDMAKERHTEHKIQNQKGQITERNSYGATRTRRRAKDRERSGGGAAESRSRLPKGAF